MFRLRLSPPRPRESARSRTSVKDVGVPDPARVDVGTVPEPGLVQPLRVRAGLYTLV